MDIRQVTRALMVIGCVLVGAGARADNADITVLSSRPGLVSGGNALVAVGGDGPVTLNGADVTAAFKSGSGGKRIGLVQGLKIGANTLKAGGAKLILTNHPITGPVFSGPHESPFICMTDKFTLPASKETLGAPLDADCSVKTRVDFVYRTKGGDFKPLPAGAMPGDLVETNTSVDRVPGSAFATGTASTRDGALLARFSSRFVVFGGGEQGGGVVTEAIPAPLATDPPVQHEWTTSPIHQLLGTQVVEIDKGRVRLTVRADKHLANERDGIHGGVGGIIGDRAAELALRSIAGDGHRYRPVEMRVLFVRPIAASGTDLAVDAEVGFFGRTTATTTARLYRPDGKLAVQVDSVHTVQPAL
jgi:uncharacterized protein (TIGR00369 family)